MGALTPEDRQRLDDVAARIDVVFKREELLRLALVHRSYLNELGLDSDEAVADSNERLEFLGDAVLGMITAQFLYERYPDLPEGQLTAFRTALVRTETLAAWARHFNLDQHLYLGRGELVNEGDVRDRILAGAFEAIIAAIYLDRGLRKTREFLQKLLQADADAIITVGQETNYKGRLQELIQERHRITPAYHTLTVSGPAHERIFEVAVLVGEQQIGTGSGSSKRAAQQEAAKRALEQLKLTEGETEE
ncbi:MAG: ribonuclease III [Sphaerobacteraceae bacterium]|nr:MAG: ribonuclease III [Sphaerobacteraceae bacterium]